MKSVCLTIVVVTLFSIAMGFMESAVVVYIRELYYPSGFSFPMVPLSRLVLVTELIREFSTMIMLLCIGILAGRNFAQRFVFFLFSFAVWDLTYYLFLKLLLNWPASLLTWDILFFIPVPWAGPVLAPCIISLTMISLTLIVIYLQEKKYMFSFRWMDWVLMISASIIFITSFTMDYFKIIFSTGEALTSIQMSEKIMNFIPENYNWGLFAAAEAILLTDFALIMRRKEN